MKKLFIFAAIIILLVIVFQKQISTHLKIVLFITQQFSQISIKPLGLLTLKPAHQKVELNSSNGKIVADLYIPPGYKHSAVIIAMGVKTQPKDKPLILNFAQTMARLGYITFWPRLEVLDQGQSLPEEPETFVESFKYLQNLKEVDPQRISYVGFSVGSSTALVASADPQIRDLVHGLVFFGGQFDIFDYLKGLASKSYQLNGKDESWDAAEDARNHAKDLFKAKEATYTARIFEASEAREIQTIFSSVPLKEKEKLKRYSPKEYVDNFKAQIFILHDQSDTFVPYVESVKLNQALKDKKIFLLINLFEHVQPNKPFTLKNIGELFKLYGFLYQVFNFL